MSKSNGAGDAQVSLLNLDDAEDAGAAETAKAARKAAGKVAKSAKADVPKPDKAADKKADSAKKAKASAPKKDAKPETRKPNSAKAQSAPKADAKATGKPEPKATPKAPAETKAAQTDAQPDKAKPAKAAASEPAAPVEADAAPVDDVSHDSSQDGVAEVPLPEPDAGIGPRVVRLVNDEEGCFKEFEGGKRIPLSEAEWRSELASQFRRNATPEVAPDAATDASAAG